MHNYDCVTRRVTLRNNDTRPKEDSRSYLGSSKVVQKASSVTIDFECPSEDFHLVQLSGR